MKYKGYSATVYFDEEDQLFVGKVIDIDSRTNISFHSKHADELQNEFETSVDAYLQMCKERNIKPRKSISGKLSLRMPPALHARVSAKAQVEGVSINKYIANTLEYQLEAVEFIKGYRPF